MNAKGHGRLMTTLLLAGLAAPLAAQVERPAADTISAPIANVRYEMTFDRATAVQRTVSVTMHFDVPGGGAAPVLLSLPAWTPGAYDIANFARYVVNFEAETDGRALRWDRMDHDTWRIRTEGARRATVRFDYIADTLDTAMSWSQPNFLLVNGTNVFLYPEGRPKDFAARVRVHTEPEWQVVTGMAHTPAPDAARTYTAPNYHDLVDMPFFIGELDLDSARVSDRWVRFATYPAGAMSGSIRDLAWEQLRRLFPPLVAVFQDVPWDTYSVMQIVDSAFAGASGLEHQNSHVNILSPPFVGSDFQPSLFAHEIFHAWNVKRLRPAEMWPYRYDRPQPTPWLWVSEGITDYYADLGEVRGGTTDERGFYALTASKINQVEQGPAVSLEDASLATWVSPVDGTHYIYYPKGSLAGFMLDIMIRDASDNRRSLDHVMRELYQTTYGRGRGFTSADWWGTVSRAAGGRSFQDFHARYIDGREPFPWDSILPVAGLRAVREQVPRIGVYTQFDADGIRVTAVEPGSTAEAAGVQPGDYLLAIGEIPVEDQQFGARFRARFGAAAPGTPLPLQLRRGERTLTLTGGLQFAPGAARIEADPQATDRAARVRLGILGGVTD